MDDTAAMAKLAANRLRRNIPPLRDWLFAVFMDVSSVGAFAFIGIFGRDVETKVSVLSGDTAAIDEENLTGDETGCRGRQENRRAAQLLRLSRAIEGNSGHEQV